MKALRCEVQHGFDFFFRYIEHFRDFVNGHTGFEIFEDSGDRHSRTLQNPRPADLARDAFHSGTLRPIK
jgi:hypothetical protein